MFAKDLDFTSVTIEEYNKWCDDNNINKIPSYIYIWHSIFSNNINLTKYFISLKIDIEDVINAVIGICKYSKGNSYLFGTEAAIELFKDLDIELNDNVLFRIITVYCDHGDERYLFELLEQNKNNEKLMRNISNKIIKTTNYEYTFLIKYLSGIGVFDDHLFEELENNIMKKKMCLYDDILHLFSLDYVLYCAIYNHDLNLVRFYWNKDITNYKYHIELFQSFELTSVENYIFYEFCKLFGEKEDLFGLFSYYGKDDECFKILIDFPEYQNSENLIISISMEMEKCIALLKTNVLH